MCGLAGIFGYWTPERAGEAVERMLRTQAHRGPDSSAVWQGAVSGLNVAVGFNRLKILDLSDAANQPMLSDDERFLLAFNGEIYNYVELRKELTDVGIKFLTRGDTEVLLRSLIYWGAAALTRLNGMWAFLLLDRVK
ncbi:MAG: asparagine synthetase B, partial [Nitrospirota bacterium]